MMYVMVVVCGGVGCQVGLYELQLVRKPGFYPRIWFCKTNKVFTLQRCLIAYSLHNHKRQ